MLSLNDQNLSCCPSRDWKYHDSVKPTFTVGAYFLIQFPKLVKFMEESFQLENQQMRLACNKVILKLSTDKNSSLASSGSVPIA